MAGSAIVASQSATLDLIPASAAPWWVCQAFDDATNTMYVSQVFELKSQDKIVVVKRELEKRFITHLRTTFRLSDSSHAWCTANEVENQANIARDSFLEDRSSYPTITAVAWHDANAATVSSSSPGTKPSHGLKQPALTITAPQDVPKGWTPRQLEQAREAASQRAKDVAASKRNEAQTKAKIDEFMENLRKRGRAQ